LRVFGKFPKDVLLDGGSIVALNQKEREWIEDHFMTLHERLAEVRIEIAKLKVKAGIWGSIGAAVVVVFAYLIRK